MRGTLLFVCLPYAQGNRHLLHTITAMRIWASPSGLTCAAENSRKHHQTLDILAPPLAEQSLGELVMAISPSTPQRLRLSEYLEALLPILNTWARGEPTYMNAPIDHCGAHKVCVSKKSTLKVLNRLCSLMSHPFQWNVFQRSRYVSSQL